MQVPEADLGRWQWNLGLCLAGGDWGVMVFPPLPHIFTDTIVGCSIRGGAGLPWLPGPCPTLGWQALWG